MSRLLLLPLLASLTFLAIPESVLGHGRIDQAALGPTFGIHQIQALRPAQTFVPTMTSLSGASLGLYPLNRGAANVTVTVRIGSPNGQIVASATKLVREYTLATTHLEHFDFPSAVAVTPGTTYAIVAEADASGPGWVNVNFDAYPKGVGISFGGPFVSGSDFIFLTCGEGQGKPCADKTKIIDQIPRGRGPGCIDFSSDPCHGNSRN